MQGLFFFTTLVTVSFLLCVLSNLSKLVSFSSFFFLLYSISSFSLVYAIPGWRTFSLFCLSSGVLLPPVLTFFLLASPSCLLFLFIGLPRAKKKKRRVQFVCLGVSVDCLYNDLDDTDHCYWLTRVPFGVYVCVSTH